MDKAGLHKLLNLEVDARSPCFIIYSAKESPRLNYVLKFIFEHALKVKYVFTSNSSEFESSTFFKINYSGKAISNSFHVLPHSLLFETTVSEIKPANSLKHQFIYFFENKNSESKTNFEYDIFASVFYFISRYEEWQSFEADVHDRFEASSSVLFKNKLHLKPVVDLWLLEFKNALVDFFKELKFPQTKFKIISTIDVDNLYAYKSKGFARTAGAIAKDILKFDFKNLNSRIKVLQKKENDPFDIYSFVSDFCSENKIPLIYFFLFRSGTKYDRTVNPKSTVFVDAFKRVKDRFALIGLHPSYFSSTNKEQLKKEIADFSDRSDSIVNLSRQHYLRFNIKTTPNLLLENNIIADFTMGFASGSGFRAGTSFPFYYYDFNEEKQTELLFVPFCAMDGAYFIYDKINPEEMLNSLLLLANEVKKTGGLFVSVFHERTFSNHLYPGYGQVYKIFHQKVAKL